MTSARVLFPAPERPVNQIVNPVFATNSFSSVCFVKTPSPAYQREQERQIVPELTGPNPSVVALPTRAHLNLGAPRDHAGPPRQTASDCNHQAQHRPHTGTTGR